ncbi:MAG: hypothetical protein ABEL97_08300 [Salinibacter sp.]
MKSLRSLDFFSDDDPVDVATTARYGRRLLVLGGLGVAVLVGTLSLVTGGRTLGQQMASRVSQAAQSLQGLVADTTARYARFSTLPARPVLRELPSHPADKLSPYMNPAADPSLVADPEVLRDFHDLLDQFAQRQAVDDNFTVRVLDRRTDSLLELHEFEKLRRRYRRGEPVEWRAVDQRRRAATRRLVDKYEARGVPVEDIIVRWGRANQVKRAQKRDQPYQAYEIQLAHYLNLSLLPTQMGTVETFNQDDLVSPAGARSRYQMMPWILRRRGINEYVLPTAADATVEVEEAHHPLLTMEPAFLLLKGYINAVGHEIPGLSAYHTGPGNIYKLYRYYLSESSLYTPDATVTDAYIWAATEGFETVREGTSFGPFSRGYIPSAYGALTARDRQPLDLSRSIRTLRVQLRPGTEVSLNTLLTVLDTTSRAFDWGPAADEPTPYERFRALNWHFDLPAAPDSIAGTPADGNVRLVSTIDGKAVRFFLPLGAPAALRAAGLDVVSPELSFRFDGSTYTPPSPEQRTKWDRRYDALVEDIEHFGFTPKNRKRLLDLYEKFKALAEKAPTPYRRRQLDIIRTHRRIWLSNPWEELSDLTMQITGRNDLPAQPPIKISTAKDTTPLSLQQLLPPSRR